MPQVSDSVTLRLFNARCPCKKHAGNATVFRCKDCPRYDGQTEYGVRCRNL